MERSEPTTPTDAARVAEASPVGRLEGDGYVLEVFRGLAGFEAVAAAWADLAARMAEARYFHFPCWLGNVLSNLAPEPERYHFLRLTGESDQRACAIVPLVREDTRILGLPLTEWRHPEHDHINYGDIIAGSRGDAATLLRLLPDALDRLEGPRWVRVRFAQVLGDSACLGGVSATPRAHVQELPGKRCKYVAADKPYDRIEDALATRVRKNLRRKRRKAEGMGALTFERSDSGGDMARALSDFLAVEASGWKGAAGSGTAIALHDELHAFYHDLAHTCNREPRCLVNRLFLGERCIAAQFSLECRGTIYLLKIAYDEEYSAISPGALAFERLLRHACGRDDVNAINFVTGGPQHDEWQPREISVHDVTLYSPAMLGRGLRLAHGLHSGLKRLGKSRGTSNRTMTREA
jgi:CelD/BcsL family acetyltransferase involved in cellulose biosynthesis